MTRFANVLKEAGDRLRVPEPTRSRILLEIAADLEDSFQHFRDQGFADEEAARRAEEAFGISDEALDLLARVHRPKLGESFAQQIDTVWGKLLLFAVLAFEVFFAVRILSDRWFFTGYSPFVWPLALVAVGAFAFTVWKVVQTTSQRSVDIRQLRVGLGVPLFLAGISLAIAGLGFLYHLQRFTRLNAGGPEEAIFINLGGLLISISSLMTIGLLTAIFAALVWFVVSRLVTRCEAREAERLLCSPA